MDKRLSSEENSSRWDKVGYAIINKSWAVIKDPPMNEDLVGAATAALDRSGNILAGPSSCDIYIKSSDRQIKTFLLVEFLASKIAFGYIAPAWLRGDHPSTDLR